MTDKIGTFHGSGDGDSDLLAGRSGAGSRLLGEFAISLKQDFDCIPQVLACFLQRIALGDRSRQFFRVGNVAAPFCLGHFLENGSQRQIHALILNPQDCLAIRKPGTSNTRSYIPPTQRATAPDYSYPAAFAFFTSSNRFPTTA